MATRNHPPFRFLGILLAAIALAAACGGVSLPSGPSEAPEPPGPQQPVELPPLTVSAITPATGATDVPIDASVMVAFSRPVDPATINGQSFQVTRQLPGAGTPVEGMIGLSPDGRVASFTPADGFANNAGYDVALADGVEGAEDGGPGFSGLASSFTTARAAVQATDAEGDAFAGPRSEDLVPPDLIGVSVSQETGGLVFTFVFAESVDPAPTSSKAFAAFIDLDVDQEASTGSSGLVDLFRPPRAGDTDLGAEFTVEVRLDGTAILNDVARDVQTGEIDLRFSGHIVTFTVPYAMIGNDDGNLDLAVIAGTRFDATDVVPDTGHLTLGRE